MHTYFIAVVYNVLYHEAEIYNYSEFVVNNDMVTYYS